MAQANHLNYWRIGKEASFNQASPEAQIAGDLPVVQSSPGLTFNRTVISPLVAAGNRATNQGTPIAGADSAELGTLDMIFYPELMKDIFEGLFGVRTPTDTAGTAALASQLFNGISADALDVEPTDAEVLEFTIASSTSSAAPSIQVFSGGVLVETVVLPTSASSIDGSFRTIGGHVAPITITTVGTITAGTLVVSGVAYQTNVFQISDTIVNSYAIEQAKRPESTVINDSMFFPGCIIESVELAFDRSADDGLLTVTVTIQGLEPQSTVSTAPDQSVALFSMPFASWMAKLQLNDVDWCEVQSMTLTIAANNGLYAVACGTQQPDIPRTGFFEVTGSIVAIPDDSARYLDYINVTESKLNLIFETSAFVNGAQVWSLDLEMDKEYIDTYSNATDDQLNTADIEIRARAGSVAVLEATMISR